MSLLGTWTGDESEMWNPKKSNILQLIISIQGLILGVAEPYYLEAGYIRKKSKKTGKKGGKRKKREKNKRKNNKKETKENKHFPSTITRPQNTPLGTLFSKSHSNNFLLTSF